MVASIHKSVLAGHPLYNSHFFCGPEGDHYRQVSLYWLGHDLQLYRSTIFPNREVRYSSIPIVVLCEAN